ncbi:MAG: AhpC/TSA family protein [Bacteroidales bacterium]|jgi:thiol-disulfide isomerase/thioredoxin|nr:AhpC/TSA family protein [Bacteroidales bacterium]
MKKALLAACAVLLLCSCSNNPVYTINANVKGIQGEAYLYNGRDDIADSCAVTDGAFTFTGKVGNPDFHTIAIKNEGRTVWATRIIIEEGTITVEGDTSDRFFPAKVSGTPENEAFSTYEKESGKFIEAYYSKDATGTQRDSVEKAYTAYSDSLSKANCGKNLLGLYLLSNDSYEMDPQALLDSLETYPAEIQKNRTATKLKEEGEKKLAVSVGKKFKEIDLNDTTGTAVSLSSVIAGNKYTLIDFWASWCHPCMGEVPTLAADYAAYGGKGFGIYGISLDKDTAAWKNCLVRNNMTWTNVSDVKGWDCAAAKDYAVNSIPSNFLVNVEGKIIATNLRGEDLTNKLEELFTQAPEK